MKTLDKYVGELFMPVAYGDTKPVVDASVTASMGQGNVLFLSYGNGVQQLLWF